MFAFSGLFDAESCACEHPIVGAWTDDFDLDDAPDLTFPNTSENTEDIGSSHYLAIYGDNGSIDAFAAIGFGLNLEGKDPRR